MSPDLNPIGHVWDIFGRSIVSRRSVPMTIKGVLKKDLCARAVVVATKIDKYPGEHLGHQSLPSTYLDRLDDKTTSPGGGHYIGAQRRAACVNVRFRPKILNLVHMLRGEV
ncbi:hypothetical protein TNCV_1581791 [Trichonephila clavipes]|nr:hypothetical protein TNCV_1581791 [Trichonephila clavipes]